MPLTGDRSLGRQAGALVLAFLLVAGSVLMVHLWVPGPQPARLLLHHAVQVAAAYTVWLALLSGALLALQRRGAISQFRVWHLWLVSLVCFGLGYAVDGAREDLTLALHHDLHESGAFFHFLRLLPVWLLVTLVFVQPYLHRSLAAEIERLNAINARLGTPIATQPAGGRIVIAAGRTRLDLPADAVSYISVEDHYCYLHYLQGGRPHKANLGLPLKELLPRLPRQFLQVHRSYVVNLRWISRIARAGRAYRLHLRDSDVTLPISRQRLQQVLPRLDAGSTEVQHLNGYDEVDQQPGRVADRRDEG